MGVQMAAATHTLTITLPSAMVKALRRHPTKQIGLKSLLGMGHSDADLKCARPDGQPPSPDNLLREFTATLRRSGVSAMA